MRPRISIFFIVSSMALLSITLCAQTVRFSVGPYHVTYPRGINNHRVVTGQIGNEALGNLGFIHFPDGNDITFEAPLVDCPFLASTEPRAINDRGDVVGIIKCESNINYMGFWRKPDGTLVRINDGSNEDLQVTGVNDKLSIVGWVRSGDLNLYQNRSFVRDRHGEFHYFAAEPQPRFGGTFARAINKFDVVVGDILDEDKQEQSGFIYVLGKLFPYRYTDQQGVQYDTGFIGINDSFTIMGFFWDQGSRVPFVLYPNMRTQVLSGLPGPPEALNSRGDITGEEYVASDEFPNVYGYVVEKFLSRGLKR